eukprot:TRINITY_DN8796_c0_g1_i1.p1 TRINITY_DN8796_c0_g1~~TRINITY_DN8796_c0_g1_i1.p1  ORF type:complete len:435 (-),score=129.52 TRINITY_DN8796_c0_g1_i1:7-1311(-)
MGRTVVIEESCIPQPSQFEHGVVIGQCTETRDVIVGFIPTPVPEESFGMKRSDVGWIMSHAREVSRMLPGGIEVLGAYVYGNAEETKKVTSTLWTFTQQSAKQISSNQPIKERLIISIDDKTKKLTGKSYEVSASQANSRVADIKTQSALASFHLLTSALSIDVEFSLTGSDSLIQEIEAGIAPFIQQIEDSTVLFGNTIYSQKDTETPSIEKMLTSKSKKSDISTISVEFLTKYEPNSSKKSIGSIQMRGCIEGRAYVHTKESISFAISAIRSDLISSLRSRVRVLGDEYERNFAEKNPGSNPLLSKGTLKISENFVLPRRNFVQFSDPITISDYVFPNESEDDSRERITAMFPNISQTAVLEFPEKFPETKMAVKKEILKSSKAESKPETFTESKSDVTSPVISPSPSNNLVPIYAIAFLVAFLAIYVAFFK